MSSSTHQIKVQAKDQTGGAFNSIKNRAAATGAQIRSMLGGAIAAAGAYVGLRSVVSGIDALGHMSDIAMKTSTNVGELTKTLNALNILGIQNMGMENLAKTFDYMQKNTGRSGLDGLKQTIAEIGKIEDPMLRGQAAMKAFGRSGMELMPLINAAHDGTDALSGLIAAMPAVPQAAADAGDAVADAMTIASNGAKSIWLQAIGQICGWFDTLFAGGIREASAAACNWVEYNVKLIVISVQRSLKEITGYLEAFGGAIGAAIGTAWEGGGISDILGAVQDSWRGDMASMESDLAELDKKNLERATRWTKAYQERAAAISNLQKNYDKAAKSTKDRQAMKLDAAGASVRSQQIRNDLVLAGSNEAAKLAAFGPQYQSEAKKQTSLLEEIAKNTEATATAVEDEETYKEI